MNLSLSRRNVLIGAGGVAVVAGAVVMAGRVLHKPTPYDDLLALLEDRDADAKLGEAVLAEKGDIDVPSVALDLRQKLKHGSLAELATKDAADGRLVEGKGWVLPETLALLCALAANAA